MKQLRRAVSWIWRRFLPRARITVRIVTAVVVAMSIVLIASGAFVYWRISFALDRQLDQDLLAYTDNVTRAVMAGQSLPADSPGEVSQTFRRDGAQTSTSDQGLRPLLTPTAIANATSNPQQLDLGRFLPAPTKTPYRIRYQLIKTPNETVVLATGISRNKHDEALRELLAQLALADLATVLAAAAVGWGATRAALGPVERYRHAAAAAGGNPSARLPVDPHRDDELTRLGHTFNSLLEEIEAGQQRERQFLADASHELRSPLALLAAEVEWAQHRPRTQQQMDEVLSSVGKQTDRLAQLANALLDLEEANDRSQFRRAPISLHKVITEAVEPHLRPAASSGRDINVTCSETVVSIESRWIEVAVSNLVANALRHGQGTVTVTGTVASDKLNIAVTDEGEGIPSTLGSNAFERFARADTARTTQGNGLGLAIVAAVAERHGGQVSLVRGGVQLQMPVPATWTEPPA